MPQKQLIVSPGCIFKIFLPKQELGIAKPSPVGKEIHYNISQDQRAKARNPNGSRPCIIVSTPFESESVIKGQETIIIVPMTSVKNNDPKIQSPWWHFVSKATVTGLDTDGYALIHQLRSIDAKRVSGEKIGQLRLSDLFLIKKKVAEMLQIAERN